MYVRYSKQTHLSETEETAMPLIYGGARRESVLERRRQLEPHPRRRNIVNDLMIGYNDNSFNSAPLDLRGLAA